jgi:uncharacterized protein YyaL (SSP411 family)
VVIRKYQLALLLLLLLPGAAAQAGNALENHPSPYLAMHGGDPVAWRDWGEAAVNEAKESGKLLFISSGYFSCHWCHVMQRESYQDPEVAALLNRWFVPVKIDRELEPALDAWLIAFTETTEGTAGWPLNVFLTSDGYPLVGMTYVPRDDFHERLGRLHDFWNEERDRAVAFSRSIVERMRAANRASLPQSLPAGDALVTGFVEQAMSLADELQGGFGDQNKFPMSPRLHVLLAIQQHRPSRELHDFLVLTLDQMANRGLRDQIAGGFFRYTVDPGWETPHYEKMLYNQAQLASLYLHAADVLNRPAYHGVARDTLDFVLSQMRGESGGYVGSLSAVDEHGEEGGSYLWSETALKALLTDREWELAQQWWEFPFGTQLPGLALPFAAEQRGDPDEAGIEAVRRKLLAERQQRLPPRDTKELAAWNGLLLKALAEASGRLGDARYATAADALAQWLLTLRDGERLQRSGAGSGRGSASLADYLYVSDGLRAWGRVADRQRYLEAADTLVAAAWRKFYGANGWQLGERPLIPGLDGEAALQDGPMPAPSALAIAHGEPEQRDAALRMSVAPVMDNPFWYASHALQLMDFQAEKSDDTHER